MSRDFAAFAYPTVSDFYITRTGGFRVLHWSNSDQVVWAESGNVTSWQHNSSSIMTLDPSGNLTVVGNGFKPGGGSWAAASDDRVKRNARPYSAGLSDICDLLPIAFEYNGEGGTTDDGVTHYGLSAQATQPIMPELVFEMPASRHTLPGQLGDPAGAACSRWRPRAMPSANSLSAWRPWKRCVLPRLTQSPPPGVVRESTAEATSGRWWDANNIRWRGGVLTPVGGNALLQGTEVSDTPRDVLTWHDNSYQRWAAYGTDTHLYAFCFDTKVLYDITPTGAPPILPPGYASGYGLGFYGDGIYGISSATGSPIGPPGILGHITDWWSMDTFGELLVVVPTQDGHLYSWDPTTPTTPATQVLNAPTGNRGVIVTDQRQVVLYGAGGDPRSIAWSDQEDMTVWTPDVTNLAGSKQLVTNAHALTACKVAAGILLFTTNDVHLMTYVGPPYAYGITQIAAGCGPISPRAVAGAGGFVAWMSLQNFWLYNGNVQVLGCDVKNWFFSVLKAGAHRPAVRLGQSAIRGNLVGLAG